MMMNQISLYPEFLAFFHFGFQRKEKREQRGVCVLRGTDDSFFKKNVIRATKNYGYLLVDMS